MLDKQVIYVTGLPRAGSTLLCQLLGHHPEIYSTGYSSPLCQILVGLRQNLSDSNLLLAQLDKDFDRTYQRLLHAFRGLMAGWFIETEKGWVVDKNQDWIGQLDTLHFLDPQCRMLVCVRELGQIYGSIEAQHQKTLLLDFPDHLAALSKADRAKQLFAEKGMVGSSLRAIEAVQDLDDSLQQHLYYVVFEHLVSDPLEVMQGIWQWLGLTPISFDPKNIHIMPRESDSYYRFKYPHQTYSEIRLPQPYVIPQRFEAMLRQTFPWFYQTFYPGKQ